MKTASQQLASALRDHAPEMRTPIPGETDGHFGLLATIPVVKRPNFTSLGGKPWRKEQ